jgi:flagellar basal-body rod modification protein FlgD
MTDIPISDVTGSLAYQPARPPERTDQLDKDAFLQLLVAQLKYQNPLSPSDPNQFMAQTAQFTMVEKLSEMAADAAAQRALGESMTATALIGREITWIDLAGEEHTGVVTGTGFGSAGTTLEVGDERVPLERVAGARTAPAATTAPTEATEEAPATDGDATNDQTQEA